MDMKIKTKKYNLSEHQWINNNNKNCNYFLSNVGFNFYCICLEFIKRIFLQQTTAVKHKLKNCYSQHYSQFLQQDIFVNKRYFKS